MSRRRTATIFSLSLDALRLAADAQAVVAMRLMHAATGKGSPRENARMIAEKLTAAATAQQAGAMALALDGPLVATDRVLRVYRNAVASNRRRLAR